METDTTAGNARLARAIDQQDIGDVIYRYCRGIDRRDYDLVRSCYHPDAIDDHGDFRGGVDDFERRDGAWRIAARVCVFEWSRIDALAPNGWTPADTATVGRVDGTDAVFAPSIADRIR